MKHLSNKKISIIRKNIEIEAIMYLSFFSLDLKWMYYLGHDNKQLIYQY